MRTHTHIYIYTHTTRNQAVSQDPDKKWKHSSSQILLCLLFCFIMFVLFCVSSLFCVLSSFLQRKTKGQQLKGKIVRHFFSHFWPNLSALFHTFWHFSTRFHTFSEFCLQVLQEFFLEVRGFTTVLAQRDEKRPKENKKKKTKPFCTLVVARLSSSHSLFAMCQSHVVKLSQHWTQQKDEEQNSKRKNK